MLLDSNMDIKLIGKSSKLGVHTCMCSAMITKNNILCSDFGLSNEEFIESEHGPIHCNTQCGSPAYAAPELLGHKEYGKEVDIWSM